MATQIIEQTSTGVASLANVEYTASTEGDIYVGKPEDLIASGILTAQQIPGWPGMPSISASFVDGVVQSRGQKPKHDQRWMRVSRYAGKVRCIKGVSEAEQRRRAYAERAAQEEAERNKPKPDMGLVGAVKAFAESGARHKVGDSVKLGNQSAVVTSEYKIHSVRSPRGEFWDPSDSSRVDYRYGYTCQYRNGEEFFYPAGALSDEHGSPTHLRLVRGARKAASLPAFSLHG